MVDNDCPCCSPPTQIQRGQGTEYLYAGGFQTVGDTLGVVYRFDASGSYVALWSAPSPPTFSQVNAIDTDRDGNIYFSLVSGNSGYADIYSVNRSGFVRWSVISGSGGQLAVAVAKDGYVYFGGGSLGVRKFNSATGVEVTSGNWPYTLAGACGALCTDQDSNVYCGEIQTLTASNVVALTAAGAARWSSPVFKTGESASNYPTPSGIAINIENTELSIACQSDSGHTNYFVADPATGSCTAGPTAGPNGGMFCTAYSRQGVRYVGGTGYLFKNSIPSPDFYRPPVAIRGVDVNYKGEIYTAQTKPTSGTRNDVVKLNTSGTAIWSKVMGSNQRVLCCALAGGKIGAWGP